MHSNNSKEVKEENPVRGNGLLLVMIDVARDKEKEFNDWYDNEHLPELLSLPGVLNARRFIAIEGSAKYLLLLELQSADVLESPEYQAVRNCSRTKRMQKHMKQIVRQIYKKYSIEDNGNK
jgi:hypothetical protein